MPRVSVNIACYNEGEFLLGTVESVRAQTFRDWELIVVDDGSDDETPRVLGELVKRDHRIRTIRTEHVGISAARNICLAASKGEYIAVHDASDCSMPERFAQQVEFLDTHPETALVGTQMLWFRRDPSDGIQVLRSPDTTEAIDEWFEKRRMGVIHATSMVRRGVFESVGGYDESLPRAVDLHLYLRVRQRYALAALPDALYAYRISCMPSFAGFRLLRHCHRYAYTCLQPDYPDGGWFDEYLALLGKRQFACLVDTGLDLGRYAKMYARYRAGLFRRKVP